MFGFFKRKKNQQDEAVEAEQPEQQSSPQPEGETEPEASEAVSDAEVQLDPEDQRQVDHEHPADSDAEVSDLEPEAESEPDSTHEAAETAEPGEEPPLQEEASAESSSESDKAVSAASTEVAEQPSVVEDEAEGTQPAAESEQDDASQEKQARGGFFSRIRKGLSKTRSNFTGGLATLFLGDKEIDDELIEDLETQLLMADIGVAATTEIIDRLTERVSRKELSNASSLYKALQEELSGILTPVEKPLVLPPKGEGPFVILVIGVNGVGKTTTIGKLARRFKSEGRSVMLAAGDTFRAAAVEQLKVWGERNEVAVVAQHTGADSASVVYDALSAARARNVDVLIADTAGRLHNKAHLMEELKKVQRVMGKLDQSAPHEVMLVVDAGTGQNAISQAETFGEAVPITGIALTKLDGTAKGGVIFALAKQTGIPIRFIGVGETLEDLRPFEAKPFTDALFDQRSS